MLIRYCKQIWAPPEPNSIVGDTEGEMVAWCTMPGRGTRLIPAGALQGVQFTRTPSYIQVVGFIDQRQINIGDGDYGGESCIFKIMFDRRQLT